MSLHYLHTTMTSSSLQSQPSQDSSWYWIGKTTSTDESFCPSSLSFHFSLFSPFLMCGSSKQLLSLKWGVSSTHTRWSVPGLSSMLMWKRSAWIAPNLLSSACTWLFTILFLLGNTKCEVFLQTDCNLQTSQILAWNLDYLGKCHLSLSFSFWLPHAGF